MIDFLSDTPTGYCLAYRFIFGSTGPGKGELGDVFLHCDYHTLPNGGGNVARETRQLAVDIMASHIHAYGPMDPPPVRISYGWASDEEFRSRQRVMHPFAAGDLAGATLEELQRIDWGVDR